MLTPATSPATSAAQTPAPAKASAATAAPAPVSASAAKPVRSADGDYKVSSAATSQTKDADGDYKPAVNVAASKSSSAVMAAVTSLSKGG